MSSYAIDRDSWSKLSIYDQMGNIGSEVGRAIKAKQNNKPERLDGAIDRALDLFDATIEHLANEKSHRLGEVLRARDEFLRLFYDDTFERDASKIEHYFTLFAVVANKRRQNIAA